MGWLLLVCGQACLCIVVGYAGGNEASRYSVMSESSRSFMSSDGTYYL